MVFSHLQGMSISAWVDGTSGKNENYVKERRECLMKFNLIK